MRRLWLLLPFLLLCAIPSHAAITIVSHSYIPLATGCSNGAGNLTCNYSITVAHTGDTMVALLGTCLGIVSGCAETGSFLATDGTNTWTTITAATYAAIAWNSIPYVVANATAGTYTVQFYTAANVYKFYFSRLEILELSGVNTTTPVDAAVSSTNNGNSTAASVVSAGNVTDSGELALAYFTVTGTISNTGSYATLDLNSTDGTGAVSLANPTSGMTTTAAVTAGTSGVWFASLLAMSPAATGTHASILFGKAVQF